MIQLQRLEGFYWVARTEGYARAARLFPYPITQPGVHQQVKRLEEELGLTLFERAGKDRVRLTAQGRALYEFVGPFIEGLKNLEGALKAGTHGGTLRVHAATMHLRYLLPSWLRRLHAKRPDIEVALTEMRQTDLTLLRSGETDLLVDWLPQIPSDIEARQVGTLYSFLAVPAQGRKAKRVKPAELKGQTFISYSPDQSGRATQLEALAMLGLTPERIYSADSAETILGFVAAGIGYSLVPSLSEAGPKVQGVVAQRVKLPGSEFPVYAAWRKGRVENPLVKAAMELAPG